MNAIWQLAVEVVAEWARALAGGVFWCAALTTSTASFDGTERIALPALFDGAIHDVASTGDATIVVSVGGASPGSRSFFREISFAGIDGRPGVRIDVERSIASGFLHVRKGSDELVVSGDDWWYVTFDHRGGAAMTTFVTSDGTRASIVRPDGGKGTAMLWYLVALPGEEPRVLELTYLPEQTLARELDLSGVVRSWTLPAAPQRVPRLVTAEPLPDGGVALFTGGSGLSMLLLSDDGVYEEVILRNIEIRQFDTAINAAGHIAIVTARDDDATIEAAVIDPAHAAEPEWHVIARTVRVTFNGREVQVVPTSGGFAAAWVNTANAPVIEAATLDPHGRGSDVIDIAHPHTSHFFDLQARDGALLFWSREHEDLIHRRLPESLSGYTLIRDLAHRWCAQR